MLRYVRSRLSRRGPMRQSSRLSSGLDVRTSNESDMGNYFFVTKCQLRMLGPLDNLHPLD